MDAGEEIKVDAAHALFLIRNSKQHKALIDENGKINIKNFSIVDEKNIHELEEHIMYFKMPGQENATTEIPIPGYVREVENLKDGAVRWVFHD
ncbi:MAG: hypothetical protein PHW64_03685 [Sulfuricurvum sp.]|nr:hypothetical protein [Sulfuricurvum sp.]